MARSIFIFLNIVVIFLIIVSKKGLSAGSIPNETLKSGRAESPKDTTHFIFQDDFEKTTLTEWKQTDDWEVSAVEKISGQSSLKHSISSKSGESSIFHTLKADWNAFNVEWSFQLKNGNWDPSSSNRFWFYLSADTIRTDLINGWAVGVNISGNSDLLELWKIRNGKADSLVVQSDLDWNSSTQSNITVKRSSNGNWSLNYQKSGGPLSKTFSGIDRTRSDFKNIGLYFNFTSTRAGQLWMDNVSVGLLPAELFIRTIELINSHQLRLTFNKSINFSAVQPGNFKLTGENDLAIAISQVQLVQGSTQKVDITFGKTTGTELRLNISGVTDLSGKVMAPDFRSIPFSFSPETGSVLINEVLFNPFSGGVDFVELVNVSDLSIPAHRLLLATRNDTLALKQIYPVSAEKRFLKPGQYLTCTKDPTIIAVQYLNCNPESFCVMKSFPTYPDDAGTVVLLNDSLEVLDEFSYSDNMHSPFLADENGVSLERISLEKSTNDRKNWTSAASSVGFATPGLPNSQAENVDVVQDEIIPDPKAFSPNGDGNNDELHIRFSLSKPGYMANVRIFDAAGRMVKFLVKNQSLSQEGSWLWDGSSNSGQKLSIGVYIILVEVFDQDGQAKRFKKTCTLTDRLE
jgi:hypothetical protein